MIKKLAEKIRIFALCVGYTTWLVLLLSSYIANRIPHRIFGKTRRKRIKNYFAGGVQIEVKEKTWYAAIESLIDTDLGFSIEYLVFKHKLDAAEIDPDKSSPNGSATMHGTVDVPGICPAYKQIQLIESDIHKKILERTNSGLE